MQAPEAESPWYRDGLRFECTKCGACCTGDPGFVWVNLEEIERLAKFVGLAFDDFTRKYVRQVGMRYSLIERPGGDCIFWDKSSGCTVYQARPVQCRTWPFWPENLETPEDWEYVEAICPGSSQSRGTGQFFSLEQIEAEAARVHTQ